MVTDVYIVFTPYNNDERITVFIPWSSATREGWREGGRVGGRWAANIISFLDPL